MREFNYEEAKNGAPVCTRQGDDARIVCWDAEIYPNDCLVVLVKSWTGHEQLHSYAKDGRCTPLYEALGDLMMKD